MIRAFLRILSLLFLIGQSPICAQIGISGPPHPSAVLDLNSSSNDKVFLPPRLTTAQRLAIPNPPVGAFVFDLDKNTIFLCDGQNWLPLLTTDPNLLPPINRTATDGGANQYFGYSVAISGDYAIVGAYNKTIGSNAQQGAAYIFVRNGNTWNQQQLLTASDGAAYDSFGFNVSISGDYAIVGAYYKTIGSNAQQGAAYVFVRNGTSWSQQQRLTANDGAASDIFGKSVAIAGDYAIVGACSKTIGSNTEQGAAYIFVRNGANWSQQQRLTSNDGATFDHFGYSVAISEYFVILGASSKTIGSNVQQGAAYVFGRNGGTWSQQQRLTASDGAAYESYGFSVAISGGYVVVGAQDKTIGNNTSQGAAYVYVRGNSSWSQQQRLTASDGATPDLFGCSVTISGDYIIVGAYTKNIGDNEKQGASYVFVRNGNTWSQKMRIADYSSALTFNGVSVGLSNGTYIIGGFGFQNNRGKVAFGTVN